MQDIYSVENSKVFEIQHTIRFKDCDAAGIVFYPRYFEMVVVLMEHWFEDDLGLSFQDMHLTENMGVPTISLHCEFKRPGLLGEKLFLRLKVLELGQTSAKLGIQFVSVADETVKLDITKTIVCIDLKQKKSKPWPDYLRKKISSYLN